MGAAGGHCGHDDQAGGEITGEREERDERGGDCGRHDHMTERRDGEEVTEQAATVLQPTELEDKSLLGGNIPLGPHYEKKDKEIECKSRLWL